MPTGYNGIAVCIAVLLPMQQLYTTKMMMWIFSIIVMCSYLYAVCLVCRVLKNIYFKEHLSVVASRYSICDMENNRNLNYVLCWVVSRVFWEMPLFEIVFGSFQSWLVAKERIRVFNSSNLLKRYSKE